MRTIWKYSLLNESNEIEIPENFGVLSVIAQRNVVTLYCLVDPANPLQKEKFHVIGTGWELPEEYYFDKYLIGTVATHNDDFVWHVFGETGMKNVIY